MTAPTPYLRLPGTAREALTFHAAVFGGEVRLHTFVEFDRTGGPPDAVAHGHLGEGRVAPYATDARRRADLPQGWAHAGAPRHR